MHDADGWAGELGKRWADRADEQDVLLGRFEAPLMEAAGEVAGLRVLDLGCGPGASSFALAARGAEVTGLDVSPDLLARAEARRAAAGDPPVRFVLGDAAQQRFDAPFDLLFSRFGAMFFADPVPAWRNLRDAVRPGGRLAVVAWRTPRENTWVSSVLDAVRDLLPAAPPFGPGAPGPFGWSEADFFERVLTEAGWKDLAWRPLDLEMPFGEGAENPAQAAALGMRRGTPAAARVEAIEDDAQRALAWERIEAALGAHVRDGAVRLKGAVWIVTATA
ncbi:MAG: methyltransferase domain-containing protein [Pseudomonadota bacterium]